MTKIALLSNVNMADIVHLLQKNATVQVYEPQRTGGELALLSNHASPLYAFAPDIIFLMEDLEEMLAGAGNEADPAVLKSGGPPSAEYARLLRLKGAINDWFTRFERTLRPEIVYYLSDAFMHTPLADVSADPFIVSRTETVWNKRLVQCLAAHGNVRVFPYRRVLERIGTRNALSRTAWYLEKNPLSSPARTALAQEILHKTDVETRIPKKVLALDLDNTLWGGLAGERDHTEIVLSDEGAGLAYKNLQRVILQMKEQGVLLVIVSKNNPQDALDVIRRHPHMVLREKDFAAMKINWRPKHENIVALANELNLSPDSFVFFDDAGPERALVNDLLPEVCVAPFPERPEQLADAMTDIFRTYFEKGAITNEDRNKTAQYAAENARRELQTQSADFDNYLKKLNIRVRRLVPAKHIERMVQLFGKTNQFNLTTRRLNRAQIEALIADEKTQVFCYNVTDCFGDLGLVAIAVLKMPGGVHFADSWKAAAIDRQEVDGAVRDSDVPVITDLIMSCRVMGRLIERAVLEDVERFARKAGFSALRALCLPTAKNKPVRTLYPELGYTPEIRFAGAGRTAPPAVAGAVSENASGIYRLDLSLNVKRAYVLHFEGPSGAP